ncbi:MAG TPA: aconitate hydratase AcnA [Vicinamibacteria bacterium]|nr:aconitate hydratase AcnA [Vicinamibacteria bacterium]
MVNTFNTRAMLDVGGASYEVFRVPYLERAGIEVARLPVSLRILLENLLRHEDGASVKADDIEALARWEPRAETRREIAFTPARVLLQDFTGVPAVVDLAAMRDAMAALGGDPSRINPLQPVELVVDHSIQVDAFASADAYGMNQDLDYARNEERYAFLRWGQRAFANFDVVPPNTGICHQVNLEHLARVVFVAPEAAPAGHAGVARAYPDTLVGTDSHTPMVNGIGVLGWGVGGIEAEAAMLGQPVTMLIPDVVGVRLTGSLRAGTTATDLVLTVVEMLRRHGVVGKFVEFTGPGLSALSVADRATVANMCPEYGATCAIFPVDAVTLGYLRLTGRPGWRVALVEAYQKEQGLFRDEGTADPEFTSLVHLDLAEVEPSVAGPRRPQDRVPLGEVKRSFQAALPSLLPPAPEKTQKDAPAGDSRGKAVGVWGEGSAESPAARASMAVEPADVLDHGSVVIAAITSCTNTSNPSVMLAAGLLAQKAAARGLRRKPWVKTSLAPGSRVVSAYLRAAGLLAPLEELGFHLVGYGCTTCIGNSGPLPESIAEEIHREGLVTCAVLSGNRNFEGRINSDVRANYLMSPPLVVAFALAGYIDLDLTTDPLATGADGQPVYLRDVWPSDEEVQAAYASVAAGMFRDTYAKVFEGDARWNALRIPAGDRFDWKPGSTYVRRPTFFEGMSRDVAGPPPPLAGLRVLAFLGDSVTTDHISPAGSIKADSPAGRHLRAQGVEVKDFNSYGARRGNHEVMVRGTFANGRIRNRLVAGREGGFTRHLPSGETMSIYDAAVRYGQEGTPLLVLAGREYGSGSSRDWAAKGPFLQGVRVVLAESYERIHRSNLVGMGIVPLQFAEGESAVTLGLDGTEVYDVEGLVEGVESAFAAGREVRVRARKADGSETVCTALARIDTPQEVLYYRHGGILQYVLRQLLMGAERMEPLPEVPRPAESPASAAVTVDEKSIASFPASDPPSH